MYHVRNLGFIPHFSLISCVQPFSQLCLVFTSKYLLRHLLLITPAALVQISMSFLRPAPTVQAAKVQYLFSMFL